MIKNFIKPKRSRPFLRQRSGPYSSAFTLIELLIVVAISALFSSIAITYSSIGRNEVALSVEAAKISQFILQAKELSIATYTSASVSCAYGVVLNMGAQPQTYSIFAYAPAGAPPCPDSTDVSGISQSDIQKYTVGTWNVPLNQGVTIQSESDSLALVLFYPPDPTVFLSNNYTNGSGGTFANQPSKIYLTATGGSSITISVNPEGQVSF